MQGIQEWAFHRRKEETAQNEDGGCAAALWDIQKASWLQEGCLKKAKMLDDVLDGVEITIQTVRLAYF